IRMMRLGRRRAISEGAQHRAELLIALHRLQVLRKPQARRAEERRPGFARQPDDLTRVGITGGEWLINKDALFSGEHRSNLIQMRSPVDALQEHGVNFFAKLLNRTYDLDAPFAF